MLLCGSICLPFSLRTPWRKIQQLVASIKIGSLQWGHTTTKLVEFIIYYYAIIFKREFNLWKEEL